MSSNIPPDLQQISTARLPSGREISREEVEDRFDALAAQVGPEDFSYLTFHRERFCETLLRCLPLLQDHLRLLVVGDWLCFLNVLIEEFCETEVSHCFDRNEARIGFRLSRNEEAWYNRIGVDLEREPWPAERESYDLVISTEVIEHFASDPMHFLCEANRILKPGGQILTSTPNGSSLLSIYHAIQGDSPVSFGVFSDPLIEHPKEYSVNELALMHEQAGFAVTHHETFSPYGKPELPELRKALSPFGFNEAMGGQVQLLVATKSGPPRYRRFAPLYKEDLPFGETASTTNLSALDHQWWGERPNAEETE